MYNVTDYNNFTASSNEFTFIVFSFVKKTRTFNFGCIINENREREREIEGRGEAIGEGR